MHVHVGEQSRVITFVSPKVSSPCIDMRQTGSNAFASNRIPIPCLLSVPPELPSVLYSSRRISQHTAADERDLAHALTRTAVESLSVVAIFGMGSILGRFTHSYMSRQGVPYSDFFLIANRCVPLGKAVGACS